MDLTVTGNQFLDTYKEFTSGGTAKIGLNCVYVTTRGSLASTVTIGGAGALGNTFRNCANASIRVISESSGVTGPIESSVVNNVFIVTDHSSTLGTSGNFPQGVLVRNIGSGAFDALVTDNEFGSWNGTTTADWIQNADGATGALSVLAEGGTMQIEARGNDFNSPINMPWFVRSDGSATTARVFFRDNTYRSDTVSIPDPFYGSFTAPGLAESATAQNSSTLDFVMSNEAVGVHDESFDARDTIQVRAQSSGTACASFTSVSTGLAGANGDIALTNSAGTFNLHDGGGNDLFQQTGVIGTIGSCPVPTGGPVLMNARTEEIDMADPVDGATETSHARLSRRSFVTIAIGTAGAVAVGGFVVMRGDGIGDAGGAHVRGPPRSVRVRHDDERRRIRRAGQTARER